MVLAAGIGSRLRPLTDAKPKALLDINGTPMLELVIRRLIEAGVDEMIVNVFHFPEQIENFLRGRKNFGIKIELSRESELLETGGGLKNAAAFFAGDERPFFLHNSDVYSDINLGLVYHRHQESGALATLSVRARHSGRRLLFTREGLLCGWEGRDGRTQWAGQPVEDAERLAFDGIHVLSPAILGKMTEAGVFPIVGSYLRLAGLGETIRAFRADDYFWRDIGGLGKLEEVRKKAKTGA